MLHATPVGCMTTCVKMALISFLLYGNTTFTVHLCCEAQKATAIKYFFKLAWEYNLLLTNRFEVHLKPRVLLLTPVNCAPVFLERYVAINGGG